MRCAATTVQSTWVARWMNYKRRYFVQ
jgi:hypothetical protein